jgi:hypothetical protein
VAVPTGDLTVIINGTTVASVSYPDGVNYPSCSSYNGEVVCQALSGYLTVQSGGVDFAVQAPESSTNLVPSQFQKLNLSPNTQNTFVLAENGADIEGYLFLDDSAPASGSVRLRVALVAYWSAPVSA